MPRSLVLLALLFSTASFAADPVRITSYSPTTSPSTGGVQVTLHLQNAAEPCTIAVSPRDIAIFGDVVVSATYGNGVMTVTAPAHASGTVNLIAAPCLSPSAPVPFTFFDAGTEPNPADYERVLFPVFFFGKGAFGADWTTNASVMNTSANTVKTIPALFFGNPVCPSLCGCGAVDTAEPGKLARICQPFTTASGLFVHVPRASNGALTFHERIRDVSRAAEGAGTEIQVVHEADFRSRVELIDVPNEALFRLTLRMYGPNATQLPLHLLFYTADHPEAPMLEIPMVLTSPDAAQTFPLHPAFAVVNDLTTTFPPLAAAKAPLRISVVPDVATDKVWAFLSITNNDTQQVTTITPH